MKTKTSESVHDDPMVPVINLGKYCEVVRKEKMKNIGSSLLMAIRVQLRISTSWLIRLDRSFIQRTKIYGDMESPCLILLVLLKGEMLLSFTRIGMEEKQIQDMMRLLRP